LAIEYRLYFHPAKFKRGCGGDFVAADMPNANRLTVGIMVMVAKDEGLRISAARRLSLSET
jgi:hypothetical protein